jgi:hypothetical protein
MAKRRTYAQRTQSKAGQVLAKTLFRKIEHTLDAAGNEVRVWHADELQSYKDEDIARALRGARAFEWHELMEWIPPSAIKYARTRGWLLQQGDLYFVTDKAAKAFSLPRRNAVGLTIKFAKAA